MSTDNILAFDRPAEFYFDMAMRELDMQNYVEALPHIRKAISKDEENVDYLLTYSEILTEIGKFYESNSVIFDMLKNGLIHSECYFGLGCNFLGVNDLDRARQSFETYLTIDPDGEYSAEAVDFITYIEDMTQDGDVITDIIKKQNLEFADEGKKLLDSGNFKEAVISLERVSDPSLYYAKNNLALAYYFSKKIDRAIEVSKDVVKRDKKNVHALCNLAMFYAEKECLFELTDILKELDTVNTDVPEDIMKMAMTYCDLFIHEKAYVSLKKYLDIRPYDEKALFFFSLAAFNLCKSDEALSYMMRLLKIDPKNTVAHFYVGYMKDMLKKGIPCEIEYAYKVPKEEADRRIEFINKSLEDTKENALLKWQQDDKLSDMLIWGLKHGDISYKLAAAGVIAGFEDEKAQNVLRHYLLDRDQPDAVKNHIFLLLKTMGAAEPYVADIGGSLVEVKVDLPENKPEEKETEDDK